MAIFLYFTIGVVALLFLLKTVLDRSLKKELSEHPPEEIDLPSADECKTMVDSIITSMEDDRLVLIHPEDDDAMRVEPGARAIWKDLPDVIHDFFKKYPYGVRWSGIGYIGGVIHTPADSLDADETFKAHGVFPYVVIGVDEAEVFIMSPKNNKIGVYNAALDRTDFYDNLYEMIYSNIS